MINKKTILPIFGSLVFLILLVSFVSAGLCKGSDGYYHDCDDFGSRYYNRNFYPNYQTEYYKESTTSSSSVISITQDRHSYEELTASSYAESNIEYLKTERDYSYPKYRRRDYRNRYDDCYYWDDCRYDRYYGDRYWHDDDHYEWDDNQLPIFVNKVEPVHYRRRALSDMRRDERDDWEPNPSLTWPYHSDY
tara:strand:+ start:574 stop:1149 length:576 start_codon:yes stop_codon:yes gene_type:complete